MPGKRASTPGRRTATANPHRTCVGNYRVAPSNRGAGARPNSSPLLASFGSTAVDLAVALVVGLARKPDDRPARDGITLAPLWLLSALGDSCRWNYPRSRCFTAQFKITHYPLTVRRHGITLTPP